MTDTRDHLHRDDCPDTLALLTELLGHRDPERVVAIGFEPTEHGAWVDWDELGRSWLSSTERAVVHIARGCAVLERAGGLPQPLGEHVVALVTVAAR